MADLDPQMLSNGIEWVYTAFFCSNSAQHLRNISEEILFGHFVTTLNDAFKGELALEDGGYESGSESLIFPLLYVEHHACIMFQHVKICTPFCLLDLPHLEHTHLNNLGTSPQCATV